ncbi:MAG TPA: hypothetical protein VN958_06180, partial [Chitinophagaceae bacterium]|nr:hypothetical protein [Chitinophagaceae bacterium]
IFSPGGDCLILTGNNSGKMQAYKFKEKRTVIPLQNNDVFAIINKKNGQHYKQEFYYGSNYLSHTSRTLKPGKDVISVTIFDSKGNKREEVVNNK